MKSICFFLPLIAAIAGCGNNLIANPCASVDSEYKVVYTQLSGNCGELAESTVTISSSGTVEGTSSFDCKSYEDNACKQDAVECEYPVGDDVHSLTTHLTFDKDGKTASGFGSLVIFTDGKVKCDSTYLIQYYRKDDK
jgi:hypothetical protein